MKKSYALIVLFTLWFGKSSGNEYLRISNVDSWWSNGPGIIESASLLIEPKGLYAECTFILEIGASEFMFGPNDNLEADMNFRLPGSSEITDLILWIDNEPVRGDWYDRWTASLIYESIVQRRIDPAILTKVGPYEYNIKIFPLRTDLNRQIQISYLTPVSNVLSSKQLIPIPVNILKLSDKIPSVFRLAYKSDDRFSGARLLENDSISFTHANDSNFGNCYIADVTNQLKLSSLNLIFDLKEARNIELITFNDEAKNENYYQLALKHGEIFGSIQKRKALFLVDFIDENCAAHTKTDILQSLESSIRKSFTPLDSFNILFSGMITTLPSETWVAGDSTNISNFFKSLNVSIFNSYSNLPTLLIDGIEFIKNHGSKGSLVVVSSSNSYGDNSSANSLILDFLESLEGTDIPIHVVDLDDNYYSYYQQHHIGGLNFNGNEYLYTRLSQMTIGEYFSIRTRSLTSMLEQVNHRISGYFKSLEVFIQTNGGYTHSNFKLGSESGLVYNDESYCLTGQYIGTPPYIITIYGQADDGTVYFMSDTIHENETVKGDSLVRSVWAAFSIRDLLKQEKDNQLMNQIISTSLSEHILTDYTAILVLEPGFEIPEDPENPEDTWSPSTIRNDKTLTGYSMEIYPNPVKDVSTISYQIFERAHVQLLLYNAQGKLVSTLIGETLSAGEYTKDINAQDLEKGIYICVLVIDGEIVARNRIAVI